VRASDKRAQFVGIAEYEAAGGTILRDLFEPDDGGWLQDPALLDRLVAEKLEREVEAVRAECWHYPIEQRIPLRSLAAGGLHPVTLRMTVPSQIPRGVGAGPGRAQ
jgi:ParB family chromosome partitioning protein